MATLSTARGRGRHTGKEDGLTNSLEYQCPYGVDRKSRALPVAELLSHKLGRIVE